MSDLDLKSKNETNSNIGKYLLFYNAFISNEQVYDFSSKIEDIGKVFDRRLKNNTKVWALSDSVEAVHPIVGKIMVTEILGPDSSMWVLTHQLIPIIE